MILQALTAYYNRLSDESSAVPEGFQKKETPFVITLDRNGCFRGLMDTREGEGKRKRAREFVVPKAVKKSVNIAANLLWGTPAYVFGKPKPDKKKDAERLAQRAQGQRQSFISKIRETFPEPFADEGIAAVVHFLEGSDFGPVFSHPLWPEVEESGANMTFQLEGDTYLVCQREAVEEAISKTISRPKEEGEDQQVCLVTGEMGIPARLHTAIKGVWGARPSGANIVSSNLVAFNSYGKTQGFNAPVGTKAEHAYTTALNSLLSKDSKQRIQVGDATTVFWAEKTHKMEEWFADFFGEPPKGQSAQDNEAIRALYSAPHTGTIPLEEDDTKFYVLGLSPNASRLAVRFWHAGTVGEVAKNLRQHFDDLRIEHAPFKPDYLSIFRLLVSTAVQEKAENIMPNLAGEVMKSILTGTPYPGTLLVSAIRRNRAEREVTYPRASLIKAFLVRESRYYKRTEKEVGMSLDRDNAIPGYLLGRLFAVLEMAQERANPGIDATIRDRFYGGASGTPSTIFPLLLKLKNHHIAKLENRGVAVNLEKQIGEIMEKLSDFPPFLSLQDQGRFAIGYYHQRQDFFRKKEQ